MNPLALFFLVFAGGLAPFALFDLRFDGLDLLAVLSLIACIAIQILHPRKARQMNTDYTYQQFLTLALLTQRLASIGMTVQHSMFLKDYDKRGTTGVAVSVTTDYDDINGKWLSDAAREAKVNEFLTLFPQTTVVRESSYGKPDMLARGVTSTGIAWEIDFHSGVCKQVQVGTKTEERFDPEALAALKKVTVEVPVYEYMCPDPILEATSA